jgi:benzoyl-CoA reductase/2-hydroxyglutaryl-CoA dehydratase subunit BcrC/BadD/HgdB
MTCFDPVIPDASAAVGSVRDQGKKVAGSCCAFAPRELIVAAHAVPVPLLSTVPA